MPKMENAVFTLNIPANLSALEAIKAELRCRLPDIKSSHRCEAVARGLGFRTYASILEAIRFSGILLATADGAAFCDYLNRHSFNAPYQQFYFSVAKIAIQNVIEKNPRLTTEGIELYRYRQHANGTMETFDQHVQRVEKNRINLVSDWAIEQFLRSLAFLSRVHPTKTIRYGTGSYKLKHIAEQFRCRYPEGGTLGPEYVCNGALIAAAIHLGFKHKPLEDDLNFNSIFNMPKQLIDDLDCEIRPDGVRAQERREREVRRQHLSGAVS